MKSDPIEDALRDVFHEMACSAAPVDLAERALRDAAARRRMYVTIVSPCLAAVVVLGVLVAAYSVGGEPRDRVLPASAPGGPVSTTTQPSVPPFPTTLSIPAPSPQRDSDGSPRPGVGGAVRVPPTIDTAAPVATSPATPIPAGPGTAPSPTSTPPVVEVGSAPAEQGAPVTGSTGPPPAAPAARADSVRSSPSPAPATPAPAATDP